MLRSRGRRDSSVKQDLGTRQFQMGSLAVPTCSVPVHIIRDVLSNTDRISFNTFCVNLSQSRALSEHIGILPSRTQLLKIIAEESALQPSSTTVARSSAVVTSKHETAGPMARTEASSTTANQKLPNIRNKGNPKLASNKS